MLGGKEAISSGIFWLNNKNSLYHKAPGFEHWKQQWSWTSLCHQYTNKTAHTTIQHIPWHLAASWTKWIGPRQTRHLDGRLLIPVTNLQITTGFQVMIIISQKVLETIIIGRRPYKKTGCKVLMKFWLILVRIVYRISFWESFLLSHWAWCWRARVDWSARGQSAGSLVLCRRGRYAGRRWSPIARWTFPPHH